MPRLRDSSAWIAAISSMRLLVVRISPPQSSFSFPRQRRIAPQPPGPGLPLQAPSVKISTTSSPGSFADSVEAIGTRARDAAMEAQLVVVLEGIFGRHQRVLRPVQPVVEAR